MFFEKMQNRKNDGFTLVELIVVIAILAILAGIGVPAYSGYVEKANMAADQQLISEVKNALTLKYYSDSESFTGSSAVFLSLEGADAEGDFANQAMVAVFGEEWDSDESIALKFSNHKGSTSGSSYNGKEAALLGKVDTLTSKLDEILTSHPALIGGTGFESYLGELGIDTNDETQKAAVADAAVLYVAQNAAQMDATQKQNVINTVAGLGSLTDPTEAVASLTGAYGSSVAAAAGLYAVAEAFCQYENTQNNNPELLTILNEQTAAISGEGVTNGTQAVQKVMDAFTAIMAQAPQTSLANYFQSNEGQPSQAAKDAEAYLNIMGVAYTAKDELQSNLGTENCFSNATISDMFSRIATGEVMVWAETGADGFVARSSID